MEIDNELAFQLGAMILKNVGDYLTKQYQRSKFPKDLSLLDAITIINGYRFSCEYDSGLIED